MLADTAGSQFAAKIGAGVAHLYMDALGYSWRANAACLSATLDPHADFIYDGGNASGHGVVLAEAHGSFAKDVSAAKIASAAKRKYLKQVKPFIATSSDFGNIIHGYSIAFGSKSTAIGSFLAISETRIAKSKSKKGLPPVVSSKATPEEDPKGSMAFATHRSNFLLIGAPEVTYWIDWLRSRDGVAPDRDEVLLIRFEYAGRKYITAAPRFWRDEGLPWWPGGFIGSRGWRIPPAFCESSDFGHFALEERAGLRFLNELNNVIAQGAQRIPARIELPTFEPAGFELSTADSAARPDREEPYSYALFRDGLALLGEPFRGRVRDVIVWSPGGEPLGG